MRLSFLILNYKTRGLLRQCLKYIHQAGITIPYEIIVVDNASGDGSVEMVKQQFPDVKLLLQKSNLGFAAGNNVGLENAAGEYIMLINPDILTLDNSIEEMIAYMDKNLTIALLGPRLLNPDRTPQISSFRYYQWYTPILRRTPIGKTGYGRNELDYIFMKDKNLDEIQDVDWLLGGAIMIRRSALPIIGFLDTRYFLYFEDMDWCRTAHAAGLRVVYYPPAAFIHFYDRASDALPWFLGPLNKLSRIHIASAIKYFTKWRALEPEVKDKELETVIKQEQVPTDL